jgi:hypothetical protein
MNRLILSSIKLRQTTSLIRLNNIISSKRLLSTVPTTTPTSAQKDNGTPTTTTTTSNNELDKPQWERSNRYVINFLNLCKMDRLIDYFIILENILRFQQR